MLGLSLGLFLNGSKGEIMSQGWAVYGDTQYTSGSPFSISADTDTVLPNNAGSKIDAYLPSGVTSLFSGGKILGREGDSYIITEDFIAVPTSAQSTLLETWLDIGGSVGQLYRRPVTFPKGQGQPLQVVHSTFVYTLDTWEQNGATPYIRGNGPFNIYSCRFIIGRVSKG